MGIADVDQHMDSSAFRYGSRPSSGAGSARKALAPAGTSMKALPPSGPPRLHAPSLPRTPSGAVVSGRMQRYASTGSLGTGTQKAIHPCDIPPSKGPRDVFAPISLPKRRSPPGGRDSRDGRPQLSHAASAGRLAMKSSTGSLEGRKFATDWDLGSQRGQVLRRRPMNRSSASLRGFAIGGQNA